MSELLAISQLAFTDETALVKKLLAELAPLAAREKNIHARAATWVKQLRDSGAGTGVEAFLHEYGLDTSEGVAVMCLAEALLRIPDAATADALIRDRFDGADWQKHLGNSDSLFVNASSWGLMLTGKVVNLGGDASSIISKLVNKCGEPVIREALKAAMRFIGQQFVMGEDIDDAINNARGAKNYRNSFDILGEGARTNAQAEYYLHAYFDAIEKIGRAESGKDMWDANSISVKLSALHPRYSLSQKDRVMAELLPRLAQIMKRARAANIMVAIDAEESSRLDIELELFTELLKDPALKGWNGVGFVVQAYQKRAGTVVEYLAKLAKQHERIIPLRLVKGAYWDSEIKWAQAAGLEGYPVFTRKEHTDVSYLATAQKILAHGECFYAQFATHNAHTISSIMDMATTQNYEFQRLHGMGEKLHGLIINDVKSRIYAPVGQHKDLLAYLIRRLLENGANSSFVHLLMDSETTLDELLESPVKRVTLQDAAVNPNIALPENMYGTRKNSLGLDLGNLAQRNSLEIALNGIAKIPAHKNIDVAQAMQNAADAFTQWQRTNVQARAAIIEKTAELLAIHRAALMNILIHEAKKTIPDAIAEVREAEDFCRYYAQEARKLMQPQTLTGPTGESNQVSYHARGVYVCISPWNFPLAIFLGQIVAALVTGNCVLAKPAEQTPNIAVYALKLLHEAGVPAHVVQLLTGGGEIGAALVAQNNIAGVVFTGSVDTAWKIQQTLAAKKGAIVPFIAETGGQNCMVVDSSALIEAAVDDIVLSAFGSAGQRCSALRVLFVQEDIADSLLEVLSGAMQELRVGDTAQFTTDIGAVIDKPAQAKLLKHIEDMKLRAKFVAAAPCDAQGTFVAPHVFEIASIGMLEGEVFGPILHVVRFKAEELAHLPQRINSTGFGLTFGVHSRIEQHVELLVSQVRAGNSYVNRSMIGATVGVQPFGGEGLSGTGPKAGGSHYLTRFITERTTSINSAAIGGNLSLLSKA